jgi:uncharacterized DUF497 family protein
MYIQSGAAGYEWDPEKAEANLRKHRIDFADAVSVFSDPLALTIPDEFGEEARFLTMGCDLLGRVVVVSHTWREERIRVISARKGTRREQRQYRGQE